MINFSTPFDSSRILRVAKYIKAWSSKFNAIGWFCDQSTLPVFSLQIFAKYCQGGLSTHPWSELEGLQPETVQINEKLVALNSQGFLTINSQPAVNGEKSDCPSVGKSFR